MCKRSKGLWTLAAWLMACAAVLMIVTHCRPVRSMEAWTLSRSLSADRQGERMPAPFPEGSVNVNTANSEELQALNGVGPVLAEGIIAEREKNGRFHYPEDLLSVKGIGQKTLNRLYSQLSLD